MLQAISRYVNESKRIPAAWIEELTKLNAALPNEDSYVECPEHAHWKIDPGCNLCKHSFLSTADTSIEQWEAYVARSKSGGA